MQSAQLIGLLTNWSRLCAARLQKHYKIARNFAMAGEAVQTSERSRSPKQERSKKGDLKINVFSFATALVAMLLMGQQPTFASVFEPNTFLDLPEDPSDGYLTLRESIKLANSKPGKDVIQLKTGNYELTAGTTPPAKAAYWDGGGALKITDDVEIVGNSSAVRMMAGIGGKSDRFMEIDSGVSVEISGLGIGSGGWGGSASIGGGILNNGKLSMRNCYIAHNNAVEDGGAVFNRGQLEATDTMFQYNNAGRNGGAIFNDSGATTTITTSEINVNSAGSYMGFGGRGGGIFNAYHGNTTIRNSKVSSNHATGNANAEGGYGGGVFNQGVAPLYGVTVINLGVETNFVHRYTSPGSYNSLVEDFGGAPVWFHYQAGPFQRQLRWWHPRYPELPPDIGRK
jgi:hypothetical protein